MAEVQERTNSTVRHKMAYYTLAFSGVAILVLAILTIINGGDTHKDTMTIFNTTLPVFASWIGTILAFYFGRENFESANQQVQNLVQRLSPEQKAQEKITSVMRTTHAMAFYQMPKSTTYKDITLALIQQKFESDEINRLPIVDENREIQYMIHESKLNKYLLTTQKDKSSFVEFLSMTKEGLSPFGKNRGFVVVSQLSSLAEAKQKLETNRESQDIFITKTGSSKEPILGWISNTRLTRYMKI